jgi:hypothetical protein
MNTLPVPHIGATLAQRAILRYQLQQRELDAERERLERTTAALQVDMLLDRVSQPEPVQMCADVDHQSPVSPWIFWPVVVACSLVLTFAAYDARVAA